VKANINSRVNKISYLLNWLSITAKKGRGATYRRCEKKQNPLFNINKFCAVVANK